MISSNKLCIGTFIIPADTTQLALADKSMGGRDALGIAGARRLAFALKEGWMVNRGEDGSPITSIDLSNNNIGVEGGKKIFDALPGGRAGSLTELDISGNDIGPEEGSKSLNFALRKENCGAKITKLSLSRNGIRDEGMLLLANTIQQKALPRLQRLMLTRNLIEDEGATLLAHALAHLPYLSTLHLNANAISDPGAISIAEAKKPPTLQHLLLTDNKIGDIGASALASALGKTDPSGFPTLVELGLGKNHISPSGCAALCNALVAGGGKKLATLSLEDNEGISLAQLANLAECVKLSPKSRASFKPMTAHGVHSPTDLGNLSPNLIYGAFGLIALLILALLFK